MTTLSDDVIFWIEVQWNDLRRDTGLRGPFTNSTKDHDLIREYLNRLCTNKFFDAQNLIKPPVTVFDTALEDLTYASLNNMTVNADNTTGTGSRPAFTLRLQRQLNRPVADALRAALGTAMISFVDLFAVVLYHTGGQHLPRLTNTVNLDQAVSSVRDYDDPARTGFPLPCWSVRTFLKRTDAYARADQLLANYVLPLETVHARTVINGEMIGAVETMSGIIHKLVMIIHIEATEHYRQQSHVF